MRLSQCMIVKNEEDNIERALSWGRGFVTEQIVVDTGSSDQTAAIAKRLGAKVYDFPWSDDFSAAKNYALSLATGDWIAFLDADEYLLPEDVKKLRRALKAIETYRPQDRPHIIRTALISLDDQGVFLNSIMQDRIFQNSDHLRYKNRIHETLYLEGSTEAALRYFDATEDITIYHTGYAMSVYQSKKKAARNVALLEKATAEQPDNSELKVYLGEALISDSRPGEADAIFRELLDGDLKGVSKHYGNLVFYHLLSYATRRGDASKEYILELYRKALAYENEYPDFDYLMGLWNVRMKNWEQVVCCFESGLAKLEKYCGLTPVHMTGELKTVYQALTIACYNTRAEALAVHYGVLCLRTERYTADVLHVLLMLLKGEPGEAQTAKGTMNILEGIYSFGVLKDRVFVRRCAQLAEFRKVASTIEKGMSQEEIDLSDKAFNRG